MKININRRHPVALNVTREDSRHPLKVNRILVICILAAVGCSRSTDTDINFSKSPGQESTRLQPEAESASLPPKITNQFGMTFRLVTIDTSRADHRDSFPKTSYYLQESRLTWEQHSAFRKAAFGDGTYETITWHHNSGHPCQWREWFEYAQALSKFDTEFDYSLPSRSQWTFACMSGYDQSCDKSKPNAFGITGLIDTQGFAEAVDDSIVLNGFEFRVLMGYWKNNWGEHTGETQPECSCEHWTACNPDADDSLDEIISGRFVLLPRQASRSAIRPRPRTWPRQENNVLDGRRNCSWAFAEEPQKSGDPAMSAVGRAVARSAGRLTAWLVFHAEPLKQGVVRLTAARVSKIGKQSPTIENVDSPRTGKS